ncbi:MAG TPA: hypothetical protein PKB06_10800 [Actinotalea sp.]|nr:hypothetical protein [Actinotalea sp.]
MPWLTRRLPDNSERPACAQGGVPEAHAKREVRMKKALGIAVAVGALLVVVVTAWTMRGTRSASPCPPTPT